MKTAKETLVFLYWHVLLSILCWLYGITYYSDRFQYYCFQSKRFNDCRHMIRKGRQWSLCIGNVDNPEHYIPSNVFHVLEDLDSSE